MDAAISMSILLNVKYPNYPKTFSFFTIIIQ